MPNGKKRTNRTRLILQSLVLAALCVALVFIVYSNATYDGAAAPPTETAGLVDPEGPGASERPAETPENTPEPTPEPTPTPFEPHSVESTDPSLYISGTAIEVDGVRLAEGESYEDDTGIYFGGGDSYTDAKGVLTFRGNNYRDTAAYGTAQMTQKAFGSYWTHATGSLMAYDGAYWSGNGWTGQPLITEWPYELRQHMNLYDWAKQQETLVEVIYPSMDGCVYFLELETGKQTRDTLNMGLTYKGTGTLDPRGYPLLYIGSGYDEYQSHVSVVSLIDCSVLYEFGGRGDTFAIRAWPMYDAAPLIDAENDKLIWAGENGILYIITLGTEYDAEAGTISVEPTRTVKWRYDTFRRQQGRYLGFEASPVIYQGYIFMPDNGGHFICLDLNTLEVVWVQDILDDANCTPVLEIEDGHPYLYVSTSYHLGWRSWTTAEVPVWKIDAETGEIVWQSEGFTCYSEASLSGGSQGSIASGEGELEGLIFLSMSRYPSAGGGTLMAMDKETGEVVWEQSTQVFSWSTPTIVYDQDGHGYVIYCTLGQYIYLFDGLTGEVIDSMYCSGKFEASPAVYGNWIVVGHRNGAIYGVELT